MLFVSSAANLQYVIHRVFAPKQIPHGFITELCSCLAINVILILIRYEASLLVIAKQD